MDGHVETNPSCTEGCTSLSAPCIGSAKTSWSDRRELYELARLEGLVHKNFHLAVLCLVYTGANVVCLVFNSMDEEFREEHRMPFHMLEFWSTFIFAVLQIYIMAFVASGSLCMNPMLLRVVMVFNIVFTFVPAALLAVSVEKFEVLAHEIEYSNEITMAAIDIVMVRGLMRNAGAKVLAINFVTALFALAITVTQLGVYNWAEDGEHLAHYFEFCFEMLSGLISFSFCINGSLGCAKLLQQRLDDMKCSEEPDALILGGSDQIVV